MKKLIFVLVFLPAFVSAQKLAQPVPPEPVPDSTLEFASQYFSDEQYQKAIDLLKRVPESDTLYASSLDMLALIYLSVDSLQQAIDVCDKGIKLKSAYLRHFYEMKGAGLDALKRHEDAIAVFNEGYKTFPKYTRFWYQIGLSYKAAKKYPEAAWNFQQYLKTNPYHSGSHLQLAIIWYNSNQLVPTLLAYQMYLLLSDDADKSLSVLKSYEDMATGQNEINMDSLWIQYPESVDNFDELETIIRSKAALTPGYKTNIKLPYTNLVKTMQVVGEKLQYTKADTGFCMQYYVPLYMDMIQKGMYPASVYYAFRQVNDDAVQKEIKKQDAATTKMANAANDFLNKYRQDQWIKMGLSSTQTWFGDNGNLTAEGKFDEAKSVKQGPYIFYHPNSMMKSKGNYSNDGKGTGKWEYYFEQGGLQAVKYFQNDMLSDSAVSYQLNGELSEVLYYKSDKLDGDARGYYPNGTLRAIIKFKDDQKNGKSVRFHSNGEMNYETTYLNGEVNGKYTEYHENGKVAETATYKMGNYDGSYKSYHSNGNLKNTGNYVDGKAEGEWKYYDEYGRLTDQGSFKGGNQEGLWKEFYPNGTLRSEGNYSGGNMSGDFKYYEDDGKLWSVLTFGKNGKLTKFKYLDKTGKVLSEGKESGGKMNLKSYHSNGLPFKEGMYSNGDLEGKHSEWNSFGKIAYTRTYKKSELDGVEKEFYNTGLKESETTYKEGVRDGLYTAYYKNGVISKQGWYKDGQQRGEWREYNPDGLLTEVNYFQDGSLQGLTRLYNIAGKLVTEVDYNESEVRTYTGLDTTGKVLYVGSLKGGAGKITTLHLNKKTDAELTYSHGRFNGEIKRYYANGKLRYIHNYSKGEKNGPFTRYDWQGNMTESGFHRDGYRDSTFTLFENNKPIMKATYFIGDINGERTWYYPDGSVETSASFTYGTLNGYMTYYAMNKEPRYRLLFKNGTVQSYSYLGPDSNWVAEIPLTNGSGEVKAKYKNGNPSAEFTYNCNWYEGTYTLYHPNGKVAHTTQYKDHEQGGISKEFYPDGKPMKEENYFYDELEGECKYYSAGGVLERVSTYKYGSLHGPTKLFDKTGKVTKTINFYNDEPY